MRTKNAEVDDPWAVLEELAAYERENRVTLDAPRAATETAAERDEVARRVP